MTLIRVGSCNHCGECCKPPVIIENPLPECSFSFEVAIDGSG